MPELPKQNWIREKKRIIGNGKTPSDQNARRLCLTAFEEALSAVDPFRCVRSTMKLRDGRLVIGKIGFPLSRVKHIFLLAVGKASESMMSAALLTLKSIPTQGILVAPSSNQARPLSRRIRVFRTGHPVPDREGIRASESVVQALRDLDTEDLLLCLFSGGASALLPAPAQGITIQDKIRVTDQLLKCGANIHEVNTVRRHISSLKGGRLVELCRASTIISLIISDVPGNPLPDIGSGLTAEDPTSFYDAIQVLRRYHLWSHAPSRIRKHLQGGLRGAIPDTPKPNDPKFRNVTNIIIADSKDACAAAFRSLLRAKLRPRILTTTAEIEAREMGSVLARTVTKPSRHEAIRPKALIVGGETTVHVVGNGLGGRNQEVALSAVDGVKGLEGIAIAALGTDGIDGNTRAAGAIIDGNTANRARSMRLDPNTLLARNDSGHFFEELGDAIITGPTGTNVSDIYLAISLG